MAQSEYEVESLFIKRLQEMQYEYVSLRNYDDVVKNFRKQFSKVNADVLIREKGSTDLSDDEFSRIMTRLEGHTVYDSAKILREKWVLPLDNGKSVYVDFLTDDETRNTYQVTHQVTMDKEHKADVKYKNRYDVTLLINGLPLVQVELKRPGVEINEAINQINRYRRHSFRGLFRYIQIFVVSNSVQTKYFSNCNETFADGSEQNILKSLAFYWTDEKNVRINKLIDFTNDFLPRVRLTEMLTRYMIVKSSEPVILVMRPYQIYAVKRAWDRVVNSHMDGFVFHTTGSGKTLTSYRLATLLRDNRMIDKVFFLIDRKDLDDQTVDEYNSFEPGCVDNTNNTKTLVDDIADSSKIMIITTIQKMTGALRNQKYKRVMEGVEGKRVVFIIDECHRSQFGKMHGDIKRHFHHANYIGFTGTPIFEQNKAAGGRTTADVFATGNKNVDPCIHKYMIKEAIADGNVLKFSVEYMRTINIRAVADPRLDNRQIDDPEYCRMHNIDMTTMYHDDRRIAVVSDDIMKNLEKHTHPAGKDIYTAIFATDKIETLLKYYDYMKEHNPKRYRIAAIFSFQPNSDEGFTTDSPKRLEDCMKDYNAMFSTKDRKLAYDLQSFDAYRKDIQKRMKQKDLPQIDLLLVVDMFLTGFDSKVTNTLILDKNLIWHSLVQAYSRTNRVDKTTKRYGQVITYRNIKKAQDDALRLYSGDGDPSAYLLQSYEFYTSQYRKRVEDLRSIARTGDEAGYLDDEEEQYHFVIAFRKVTHTLSTLKTFSKFDWKDLAVFLDEDEYEVYKSWYLSIYDKMKKDREQHKTTILSDIDFDVEFVRTDRINVVYILRLLRDTKKKTKAEDMKEAVDLILREIDRSDNEKLRHKKEIMKAFIRERFYKLDQDEDVESAYEEFERERLQANVEEFSQKNGVPIPLITEILNQYFCDDKSVTKEYIRQKYNGLGLGILKMTKLINETLVFVRNMYDKFTAEDE